jgi:hypothetical protein
MISANVEALITEAVLYRLDTPDLAAVIEGRQQADATSAALSEAIANDTAQLEELAALYAAREITAPEWLTARKPIEARRNVSRRRQAHQAGSSVVARHVGQGGALRREWPEMSLGRQAAVVRALIDHITINPGNPRVRTVDPARIDVHWRL